MNTCGTVSSWNVYENSQDFVNITIRFDKGICCASMDSQACPVTLPVAYKKQSPKQTMRNRQRANNHKSHLGLRRSTRLHSDSTIMDTSQNIEVVRNDTR